MGSNGRLTRPPPSTARPSHSVAFRLPQWCAPARGESGALSLTVNLPTQARVGVSRTLVPRRARTPPASQPLRGCLAVTFEVRDACARALTRPAQAGGSKRSRPSAASQLRRRPKARPSLPPCCPRAAPARLRVRPRAGARAAQRAALGLGGHLSAGAAAHLGGCELLVCVCKAQRVPLPVYAQRARARQHATRTCFQHSENRFSAGFQRAESLENVFSASEAENVFSAN